MCSCATHTAYVPRCAGDSPDLRPIQAAMNIRGREPGQMPHQLVGAALPHLDKTLLVLRFHREHRSSTIARP